jgi:tetrahydromethanopterin S-methyltransferase subunit C
LQKPKPYEIAAVIGAVIGVVGVQVFNIPILSPSFAILVLTCGLIGVLIGLWMKRWNRTDPE